MSKNSTWESTVKPVVVLSVIALIVSLLLALVNSFTAPIIEEHLKAATLAAYVDVMPTVSSASDLDEVTDFSTENVTGVVKATDGSIAIKAEEKGFDGGILSGGLMFGAVFMATDYVTSPFTLKGKLIYGLCLGIVTFAIRQWGSYAEGVSFALLFMNLWVPFINDWTRQTPYGYVKPAKKAKEGAGK